MKFNTGKAFWEKISFSIGGLSIYLQYLPTYLPISSWLLNLKFAFSRLLPEVKFNSNWGIELEFKRHSYLNSEWHTILVLGSHSWIQSCTNLKFPRRCHRSDHVIKWSPFPYSIFPCSFSPWRISYYAVTVLLLISNKF